MSQTSTGPATGLGTGAKIALSMAGCVVAFVLVPLFMWLCPWTRPKHWRNPYLWSRAGESSACTNERMNNRSAGFAEQNSLSFATVAGQDPSIQQPDTDAISVNDSVYPETKAWLNHWLDTTGSRSAMPRSGSPASPGPLTFPPRSEAEADLENPSHKTSQSPSSLLRYMSRLLGLGDSGVSDEFLTQSTASSSQTRIRLILKSIRPSSTTSKSMRAPTIGTPSLNPLDRERIERKYKTVRSIVTSDPSSEHCIPRSTMGVSTPVNAAAPCCVGQSRLPHSNAPLARRHSPDDMADSATLDLLAESIQTYRPHSIDASIYPGSTPQIKSTTDSIFPLSQSLSLSSTPRRGCIANHPSSTPPSFPLPRPVFTAPTNVPDLSQLDPKTSTTSHPPTPQTPFSQDDSLSPFNPFTPMSSSHYTSSIGSSPSLSPWSPAYRGYSFTGIALGSPVIHEVSAEEDEGDSITDRVIAESKKQREASTGDSTVPRHQRPAGRRSRRSHRTYLESSDRLRH